MIHVSTTVRWAGRMENHDIMAADCDRSSLRAVNVSRGLSGGGSMDERGKFQRSMQPDSTNGGHDIHCNKAV